MATERLVDDLEQQATDTWRELLGLIEYEAGRLGARYYGILSYHEILEACRDAAVETIKRFDVSRGFKIGTLYKKVAECRTIDVLRERGHLECRRCGGTGELEGQRCPFCRDGWTGPHEVSAEDAHDELVEGFPFDDDGPDPYRAFQWSQTWWESLSDRSPRTRSILCDVMNELPYEKRVIWWDHAMARNLTDEELRKMLGMSSVGAVRKARFDAIKKVEAIVGRYEPEAAPRCVEERSGSE